MQAALLNKNFMTQFISLCILILGLVLNHQAFISVGAFALSGGFTNWIAIYMLFERVPGLYGSGVIQNQFEDFKKGIESLIMKEFFSHEHIQQFARTDIQHFLERIPLDKVFDALLDAVSTSSLGGLLNMIGGPESLRSLQPAFEDRCRTALQDYVKSPQFENEGYFIRAQIEQMVKSRLDQLTPVMVKNLIQEMIHQHLGWLVVWGGVFGGLLGLIAAVLQNGY
jgi:uncharacterized membrane protein YheB (UPF0754 family)